VYTFVELKLILQYAFYFSIVAANDYNMLIIMASYCKLCGKDSKLANTLSNLEIGDMIPPELYTVVAEILVFVDKTDKLRGKIHG